MDSKATVTLALAALGAAAVLTWAQAPAPSGAVHLQTAQDPGYADLIKTCKVPPPARGGRGGGPGGGGRGAAAAPPSTAMRDYKVTEIPGVIAAGQTWKEVWKTDGNNADGIIGTKDGGILIAQNTNGDVLKLDRNGKVSTAYSGTNTGGAVSMNTKGVLFVNNRGLHTSIEELAPKRHIFTDKINGDPLDCIGGVLNDLSADSKGGVYFTMGGVFYADPQGVVTRYGQNLNTNGIILSRDEKTLFVTNGGTLAAFDVQPNGSLTNQREFAKLEGGGGGDGSTIDSMGRIYVTTNPGVQVISPEGKYLGIIPTPQNVISAAFSGKDKKTLYAVVSIRDGNNLSAQIITIPMIAQGFKGRAK
ncbi:MAG TPA: SMP-30/gluconolactonase/LRE family protein [Bryobacteraceae bacterium]|nr:SMP-30/gluconolactonase/LRE family protein [Bryobacteraceae bacterium]